MRIRHIKGADEEVAKNPFVIQEPEKLKGCWRKEAFGNASPIFLEVGMGMGTFIRESSFLNGDINYIGFELNTTVLFKALRRYERELEGRGLSMNPADNNLRFIRNDARFLRDYFDEGEIDRIYLNFSDPWPKDKNANKRLTSPGFLALYDKILKKDGRLEFKTDNRGLFDYSVEVIPKSGWVITAISYDLHNDAVMNEGNIMTEYEAKFSAKGNPIYKLIAVRGEIKSL